MNDSLTSLAGLESLEFVHGNLRITENYSLTSLAGLESLEYVRGYMEISYADLTSLEGLESLKHNRGYMSNNQTYSLRTILAEALSYQVFVGGSTQISYNDDSC